MGRALENMRDILADEGWLHLTADARNAIETICIGHRGSWHLMVWEHTDSNHLALISRAPFFIPTGLRAPICEFFMGLNQCLLSGTFILNFENGGVELKSTLYLGQDGVGMDILREFFYSHLAIFDQSLPTIEGILFNDLAISEALIQLTDHYQSRDGIA